MKKTIRWAVIFAALVLAVSCATTPPQKPVEQPAEQPVAQPEAPKAALPEAELAKAKELQEKADRYGLGEYAPDEYAAAVKSLAAGQETYGTDNAASKKSLDQAIVGFTTVIDKGGALYLGKLQDKAAASKKAADELKASVAVKDDYASASVVYTRAIKERGAKDIDGAAADFTQAADLFDAVAEKAKEKKAAADAAMSATDASEAGSKQAAVDAEKKLDTDGFTAEGGDQQGGGR
jgi:hypothetical protein